MKAKRFFSVLLVMLMVVSCFAISASADVPEKPTTGNLHIVLKDATAGAAGTGVSQEVGGNGVRGVTFNILKVDDNATDTTTPAEGTTPTDSAATNTAGEVNFNSLVAGRYLVWVTDKPDSTGSIANFLVDVPMTNPAGTGWLSDVYVYPKTSSIFDEPVVDKAVKGGATTVFTTGTDELISVAGTDTITWKISVKVPAAIDLYNSFTVTDTVDSKLVAPTDPYGITVRYSVGTLAAVTKTVSGQNIEIVFDPTKLEAGKTIEIEYATTILPAEVASVTYDDPITNQATVSYTNQPTASHTSTSGDVPSDEPGVYTGKLTVDKVNAASPKEQLMGATFELFKNSTLTTSLGTQTTTGTGDVYQSAVWTGLADGIYYLKETVAPTGYELNDQVFTVTVTNGVAVLTSGSDIVTSVKNIAKPELPLTGGMGVAVFALLGLAFVAIGGVSLYKTRKSN